MSVNVFHKTGSGTGTLQKVAGNTVILDATTSETRAGTFNISRATSGTVSQNILFDNPMPDANYMVNFELTSGSGNDGPGLVITNKSTTGFTVSINTTGAADLSVEYNAFKLVELKDYTSMQNAILNADSSPTQNSENLIKSGGVFEALKGAGTVFTGTKSEWENLDPTDQERYEVVCITNDEESGGGGVPIISETGSFPGQANQFPKIVTLQNNFTKLYSFHQVGIPGSGWIAGWEFEAPNTVKVYPYTVYEGNYTPLNGSIFSFNYEAIGE